MPKKQRNAFYFFMLDWKKKQEKWGKKFPNGLRDVPEDKGCSSMWKSLTPHQRKVYEDLAKNVKNKEKGEKEVTENPKIKEELMIQSYNSMQENISQMIRVAKERNYIHELNFYFIHASHFYVRQINEFEADYEPAEFAIAEFSLVEGIQNVYHEILRVKPHLGFAREAIETSNMSHKIPPEFPEGESDYNLMRKRFLDFIQPRIANGQYPTLYCTKSATPVVQSVLQRFFVDRKDIDIPVYSLEMLFSIMRNACNSSTQSVPYVVAEYELLKDSFTYAVDIECRFHKEVGGSYENCSMALVKRWGFTLCDHCCPGLDLDMIPGIHVPKNIRHAPKSISSAMKEMIIEKEDEDSDDSFSEEYYGYRPRRSSSRCQYKQEEFNFEESKYPHREYAVKDTRSQVQWRKPQPFESTYTRNIPLRRPLTESVAFKLGQTSRSNNSDDGGQPAVTPYFEMFTHMSDPRTSRKRLRQKCHQLNPNHGRQCHY